MRGCTSYSVVIDSGEVGPYRKASSIDCRKKSFSPLNNNASINHAPQITPITRVRVLYALVAITSAIAALDTDAKLFMLRTAVR